MPTHTDILHIDGLHADVHADGSHGDLGDVVHADGVSAHVDAPAPHVDIGGHADGGHIDLAPPDTHVDQGGAPGVHADRGAFHVDGITHADGGHFDLGGAPGLPDFAGAFTALSARLDVVVGQVMTTMTDLMRQQQALLQTMASTAQTGIIGVQTSLSLVQQQQLRTVPDLLLHLRSLQAKDAAAERERLDLHQQELTQAGEQMSAALEQVRQALRDRMALAAKLPPSADAPATAQAKWLRWTEATFAGMSLGVDQWRLDAELQDVRIVGGLAIGTAGALRSSTGFAATIRARLIHAHAPEPLAHAVSEAIWQAWTSWADKVMIPGLPWYPAFFAWPGPVAPMMPNAPSPLSACVSSGLNAMLPQQLSAAITTRLTGTTIAGSDAGIGTLATQVSAAFIQWLAGTYVMMAFGSGTTAVAPPFVPVGPVNGAVVHSRGCLAAGPPFPAGPSPFVP
jgi:hypothetical protein